MASGCQRNRYVPPPSQMPPNTVPLSQMMRELSAKPGFTDQIIAQLNRNGKEGPALLTPALLHELRTAILGKNWIGLDRFPGWSMHEINPAVRIAGHIAGRSSAAENLSAVHPGAPPSAAPAHDLLEVGPYALDQPATVSLAEPSTLPPFTTDGIVMQLGPDVQRGDGPNDLAPEHAESQRLAFLLNRLSVNATDGVEPLSVSVPVTKADAQAPPVTPTAVTATSPAKLIDLLASSGHEVTVTDSRYFANFGHFHYQGKDVMMPFWVDSQIVIPDSDGRPLLVPVSHAEYEWRIRGPWVNADVSYYFGVDGKSQWRTMDTLDQAWVLKRNAHTYRGPQAVEVTRLAGLLTVAYQHLHAAHAELPFGGYYALGVCQDGVSAIEHHMTGQVTLFPNTADTSFFTDPRDSEINALFAAIPKDRNDTQPDPARIFASLPADPGPDAGFRAITIPGLAEDLHAVHAAWTDGTLNRTRSPLHRAVEVAMIAVVSVAAFAFVIAIARRRSRMEEDI